MANRPPFSDDDAFSEPDDENDYSCIGEGNAVATDESDELEDEEGESDSDGEDAVADAADAAVRRSRMDSLVARARTRSEQSDCPLDSNYDYVRDRIDISELGDLDDAYWTLRPHQRQQLRSGPQRVRKTTALIIDDDEYRAREYGFLLSAQGIQVSYAFSVDDALRALNHFGDAFSFITIDIRMPHGDYFSSFETVGGLHSGVELAREIQTFSPTAKLIALTNSDDALDESWFSAQENAFYCKKNDYPPDRFAHYVRSVILKDFSELKTFIIHGHDKLAALELKNYLQNSLGFSQPIILSEQKSKGMTVIEKLEYYLSDADLVFALFTPDDFMTQPKDSKRARQNVVFEFGIVVGKLGRKSGRIFYLYNQGVEIPSDLTGMVYIDVTNGIAAAGEEIRLELDEHLK